MPNRLAKTSSPYLLQHKDNPVDWYPWGDEALSRAKAENKPIFLSIGYSSCHWCHVMERESFADASIAEVLNQHFIPIKVDREERPDLDHIYMTAIQAMTGRGGWPLNVFLTPDLKPYFGGTYFAPDARYGQPPFKEVLLRMADAFHHQKEAVRANADQIMALLLENSQFFNAKEATDRALFEKVAQNVQLSYDSRGGGLGGAPKFFHVDALRIALRVYAEKKDPDHLEIVENSLQKMAGGGVYDQLGGGFHRYSTDALWQIPHFEKMLYDNALLSLLFVETWKATGRDFYKAIATETLEWVLREMTSDEGCFYSAIDADSEHHEGLFYSWDYAEIMDLVPEALRKDFASTYGLNQEANFEGRWVLHTSEVLEGAAREKWAKLREKLRAKRDQRTWPLIDKKILVSWNGLMISALSQAGFAFQNEKFLAAAKKAADAILSKAFKDGRLAHTFMGENIGREYFLEDAAYFSAGLLDLFEASMDEKYFEAAERVCESLSLHFYDASEGGFWSTAAEQRDLILRYKEVYDGALPSPYAVALSSLLQIYEWTGHAEWLQIFEKSLRAIMGSALANPGGFHRLALVVDDYISGLKTLVSVGTLGEPLNALRKFFSPRTRVLRLELGRDSKLSILAGKQAKAGYFLCTQGSCQPPVDRLEALQL